MKSLLEYLKISQWPSEKSHIYEMATISKAVDFNGTLYRIAVHGPGTKDRENPHVHIYLSSDRDPYNKFNFEISLCDILCKDEINLIKMRDEKKHIKKNNRSMCSWNGYAKLRNAFEDWLWSKPTRPGEFKDNLDAIIWNYNNEGHSSNDIKEYIESRGWKVLPKYKEYIERNYTHDI